MPHSAAALAEALHLTLAVKKELSDLGGRLRLALGHLPAEALRVPPAVMEPIPGIAGMWWLQLPCAYPEAPTCTRLMVGGLSGAVCPQATVPHGVRLQLMEGTLMWWQEALGHDALGQRIYHRYDKHDVWELAENEEHGFVALTDFLSYNVFTPCFID